MHAASLDQPPPEAEYRGRVAEGGLQKISPVAQKASEAWQTAICPHPGFRASSVLLGLILQAPLTLYAEGRERGRGGEGDRE